MIVLLLIGGALSILAGIVAFVWPGRTLLVISVVLAWFLAYGFTELFAAFDLRGLGHRLDRGVPEQPAM